ncbi:hypothetical protein Aperf_G00000054799 [Anoplocephala perfoliata]
MVFEAMGHLFRKFKRKKSIEKASEGGYVAPKAAHKWERRKKREEKLEKEKQEHVTETKVNPWLQLCGDPKEREAMALFSLPGDEKSEELKVLQGDPLTVESINRSDVWWETCNNRTGKLGFMPWNYITEEVGIRDVLNSWFDIDRRESEAKLLMADLPNGTYILRPSSNPLRIALSVLCIAGTTRTVKHFIIRYDRTAKNYFISPSRRFHHLKELTDYYETSHHGNDPFLSHALPQHPPAIQSRKLWISSSKVDLKSHLAHGGRFGSVYRAICTASVEQKVVVKKMPVLQNPDPIIKQAEACHKLQNPSIVHFLGLCKSSQTQPYLLVWEYMPGGNLKDFIVNNKSTVDYSKLQLWLYQVLDGMDYLECVGSHHGELTASNVFLSHELCAKIGNFGFNGQFGKTIGLTPRFVHTEAVRWAAPEAWDPFHIYDIRSDVWSFGVLMFEVLTYGSKPYAEVDTKDVAEQVKNGCRLPNPSDLGFKCDNAMYDAMKSCWFTENYSRPTFRELWISFDEHIEKNTEYEEIKLPF